MKIDKMKLIECINECKPYNEEQEEMEEYKIDSSCDKLKSAFMKIDEIKTINKDINETFKEVIEDLEDRYGITIDCIVDWDYYDGDDYEC